MILITGANGQLGRLVIEKLLQDIPAKMIVAAVRHPEKAHDLRLCRNGRSCVDLKIR
ncbi:SDR family oxidoreductase [Herminiimonas arsenitoxidans]|uniref:SDR family oxidoreductase n=1 Tax=Herminiimonas arsenitoxidans TaxID=1809410 RepID=UPI002F90F7A5